MTSNRSYDDRLTQAEGRAEPERRHRGPKQVLPSLPPEAYAGTPKNVPYRYLSGEQLERRRLYDAQRQRDWRRKQATHRNSPAGALKSGQVTMDVGTHIELTSTTTAPAPTPTPAPEQDVPQWQRDLEEIRKRRG